MRAGIDPSAPTLSGQEGMLGIDANVVDGAGTIVKQIVHPAMNALCKFARDEGLPTLAHVDKYDDTRFTELQMGLVIPELRTIAATAPPDIADVANQLLQAAELLLGPGVLYLEFIGD